MKRILDYGPKIKVVAKKVDGRIKNIKGVEWEEREFEDSDVEGVRFVIAAAGDEELDEHITSLCNDKGILINVVDVKDKCDFIFPSVVSRGKEYRQVVQAQESQHFLPEKLTIFCLTI